MTKLKTILISLLLGSASTVLASTQSQECESALALHLESDLTLSYHTFDQTMQNGWRRLANKGCYEQSAKLIDAYMKATKDQSRSLHWHKFQMLAYSGHTQEALLSAEASLVAEAEQASKTLAWNPYVKASMAFLKRDLAALKAHKQAIEEKRDAHPGNAMNLKVVERLIAGFDSDYQSAYEGKHAH